MLKDSRGSVTSSTIRPLNNLGRNHPRVRCSVLPMGCTKPAKSSVNDHFRAPLDKLDQTLSTTCRDLLGALFLIAVAVTRRSIGGVWMPFKAHRLANLRRGCLREFTVDHSGVSRVAKLELPFLERQEPTCDYVFAA